MAVRILSAMYKLACEWGIVPEGLSNPCRSLMKYPEHKRERFLTDEEFIRLGEALDEVEAGSGASAPAVAAIRLLALTGCRRSEILSLRWEDVALEESELKLPDAKTGARAVPLRPGRSSFSPLYHASRGIPGSYPAGSRVRTCARSMTPEDHPGARWTS